MCPEERVAEALSTETALPAASSWVTRDPRCQSSLRGNPGEVRLCHVAHQLVRSSAANPAEDCDCYSFLLTSQPLGVSMRQRGLGLGHARTDRAALARNTARRRGAHLPEPPRPRRTLFILHASRAWARGADQPCSLHGVEGTSVRCGPIGHRPALPIKAISLHNSLIRGGMSAAD